MRRRKKKKKKEKTLLEEKWAHWPNCHQYMVNGQMIQYAMAWSVASGSSAIHDWLGGKSPVGGYKRMEALQVFFFFFFFLMFSKNNSYRIIKKG